MLRQIVIVITAAVLLRLALWFGGSLIIEKAIYREHFEQDQRSPSQ